MPSPPVGATLTDRNALDSDRRRMSLPIEGRGFTYSRGGFVARRSGGRKLPVMSPWAQENPPLGPAVDRGGAEGVGPYRRQQGGEPDRHERFPDPVKAVNPAPAMIVVAWAEQFEGGIVPHHDRASRMPRAAMATSYTRPESALVGSDP